MNLSQILVFIVTVFLRVVLVPGVLIVLLVISWHAAYRSPSYSGNLKVSKILAFWFGLVLFMVLVVSTIFVGPVQSLSFDGSVGAFIAFLALGIILGIAVMISIDILVQQRAAAVFISVLSSMSLAGLYYYVLTLQASNPILIVVLGVLLGGLFYAVFIRTPEMFVNLQLASLLKVIWWVGAISILFAVGFTIFVLVNPQASNRFPTNLPLSMPTHTLTR